MGAIISTIALLISDMQFGTSEPSTANGLLALWAIINIILVIAFVVVVYLDYKSEEAKS